MSKLLIWLLLFPTLLFAKTIEMKQADFPVELRGNDIYYSLKFLSYKKRMPQIVKDMDVEGFRRGRNELIFSKSVFVVNRSMDDFDERPFLDGNQLAQVFDATKVADLGNNSWKYKMSVTIKKIAFTLHAFVGDGDFTEDKVDAYVDAIQQFDTELDPTEKYVVQVLDGFSEGIKSIVIVSKLIRVGDKTLVVAYQLSAFDYRWYKKYNIFNSVKKVFKKRVVSTLVRTKQVMESY